MGGQNFWVCLFFFILEPVYSPDSIHDSRSHFMADYSEIVQFPRLLPQISCCEPLDHIPFNMTVRCLDTKLLWIIDLSALKDQKAKIIKNKIWLPIADKIVLYKYDVLFNIRIMNYKIWMLISLFSTMMMFYLILLNGTMYWLAMCSLCRMNKIFVTKWNWLCLMWLNLSAMKILCTF